MIKTTLINARETLLSQMVGKPEPLNLGSTSCGATSSLAAELRQAMNQLKITAIDEGTSSVDYAALRANEAYTRYANCAAALAEFDPATLTTREEQLAFWINLYNALVIHAVIALNVQRSVAEDRFGLAFFRRAAYRVSRQTVNCDDIEHGILRANRGHPFVPGPQFSESDPRLAWVVLPSEARIHFALNCASRSCSPIAFYDPARIEQQLDQAARAFITQEVQIDAATGGVQLSRIFDWYKGDFGGQAGVLSFMARYLPEGVVRQRLQSDAQKIRLVYRQYNWALNTPQLEETN